MPSVFFSLSSLAAEFVIYGRPLFSVLPMWPIMVTGKNPSSLKTGPKERQQVTRHTFHLLVTHELSKDEAFQGNVEASKSFVEN